MAPVLPLPLQGERVGVRGSIRESCSHVQYCSLQPIAGAFVFAHRPTVNCTGPQPGPQGERALPTLKELIAADDLVVAPVALNPIMARLAEQAGFKAVYLS